VVGAPAVDGKDAVWTAGEDTYSVMFFSAVWVLLSTARASRCSQAARTDWSDCCKKAGRLLSTKLILWMLINILNHSCVGMCQSVLGDKRYCVNHILQKRSSFQGLAKYCEYSRESSVSIVTRLQNGQQRIRFPIGGLFFFNVHVTVHRDKFPYNKTN
jgi:hypothetical protein